MKVDADVIDTLRAAATDGPRLVLPAGLDKKLYGRVNKIVELAGGKWSRRDQAHVFEGSAENAIAPILEAGTVRHVQQEFGQFYSPPAVADAVIAAADLEEGLVVLEPSAGRGALAARAYFADCEVDCIEIDPRSAQILCSMPYRKVVEGDFLEQEPWPVYDRVVMNPPFAKGADIRHVMHAAKFLKPGGRLVAVMGGGVADRQDKAAHGFRTFVEARGGSIAPLPLASFAEAGTKVNAFLVVFDAPETDTLFAEAAAEMALAEPEADARAGAPSAAWSAAFPTPAAEPRPQHPPEHFPQEAPMPTTALLAQLRLGDKAGINARVTGRKNGIEELAADIDARGLIHPLAVRPAPDADGALPHPTTAAAFEVIAGNRRLQALQLLVRSKRRAADEPVPIVVRLDGDADAFETSLAENVQRVAMHPVDEHEAFVKLVDARTPAEIAIRFGTTERHVNQRLALGRLAPELRRLWRKGDLSAEQAKVLTVADDHARQLEVWAAAKKSGAYYTQPDSLRSAVAREYLAETEGRVQLVGVDAYLAAGGTFVSDLFAETRLLRDRDVVDRLVAERLEAAAAELRAEGWGWAEVSDGSRSPYGYPRLDLGPWLEEGQAAVLRKANGMPYQEAERIKKAAYERMAADPAGRAACGCLVRLDYKGEIEVLAGLLRPETVGEGGVEAASTLSRATGQPTGQPAPQADPKPEAGKRISAALAQSLSEALTVAASRTLSGEGGVALAVACAALGAKYGSPARVSVDGYLGLPDPRGDGAFSTLLKRGLEMSLDDRLKLFAGLLARSLDLTVASQENWGKQVQPSGIKALVDALDPGVFRLNLADAFDLDAYFAKVPAKLCVEALDQMESGGSREGKKADLAKLATAEARRTRWLPPELRTAHYDGPAAPKPKGEKPAEGAAPKKRGGRKAAGSAVAPDVAGALVDAGRAAA